MYVKDSLIGLFSEIEDVKPILIFNFISADVLDTYYLAMYGNRKLSSLGGQNIETIAKVIANMYGDKWDKTIETYLSTYLNIDKDGYSLDEQIDDTGENTLSRNVLKEISAYNEDVLVTDNQDNEEQTGTTTNLFSKEKKLVKMIGIDSVIKIINYLKNEYIYDIIIDDINKMLTIGVFN